MKISELRKLIREEVREAISNENTKLNLKKNGIYILDGGLNNNDTWDEKSLKKAQVLYYTTDFRDPKLEKYKKDGIVRVEITNGGDIDVVQY